MKSKLQKKMISTIALLLTAIILQFSGGSIILVPLLAGSSFSFLPRMFQQHNAIKRNINYTISTTNPEYSRNNLSYVSNNQEFDLNKTNKSHKSIDFANNVIVSKSEKNNEVKYIDLIQEIETPPQIIQSENINRLVRKKKK